MKKKLILVGAMLVVSSQIFAQQENETQIEEVTVAGKVPQQLFSTGKNVKLLTSKDLQKFKGQSLNDVLDQVAGFQITGNFNAQNEPKSLKIRGGKSANILILLDGIPLKDATANDYSVADLRLIALENVESIEVLNGASSVLYGSNATVSVINIKTKRNAQKKIEGLLSARGGSFNTFAQDVAFQGKLSKFHYQISVFNEKSEGISAALGENFDADGFERQNLAANVGYREKNFEIRLNSGWNHNLYEHDYDAFTDGNLRGDDQQFYVGGNASLSYGKGKLIANIRKSSTNRISQNFIDSKYQNQYEYKGNHFFAELYNSYSISEKLNILGGVQFEEQSLSYFSVPFGETEMQELIRSNDTNSNNFDAFLNLRFQHKTFHFDAGSRLTFHSKFGNHLVYSLNPYFLKDFGQWYFKAGYSFATAFIAPTLYQNFGQMPYVLPNFDLQPETNQSHEVDVSFGNKDRTLNFSLTAFQRSEKDVFAYATVDPQTFAGQFQNIDQNKAKGLELSADYKINDILKVGGNYSFVEKDRAETMLRQPKHRVNSYVELLPFQTTRINLFHQFIGKRSDYYYDSGTWSRVDVENESFHIFGLNVNQKISSGIEAFVNIGNLFNKSYIDVIGYTTKPRNYTVGLSYRF